MADETKATTPQGTTPPQGAPGAAEGKSGSAPAGQDKAGQDFQTQVAASEKALKDTKAELTRLQQLYPKDTRELLEKAGDQGLALLRRLLDAGADMGIELEQLEKELAKQAGQGEGDTEPAVTPPPSEYVSRKQYEELVERQKESERLLWNTLTESANDEMVDYKQRLGLPSDESTPLGKALSYEALARLLEKTQGKRPATRREVRELFEGENSLAKYAEALGWKSPAKPQGRLPEGAVSLGAGTEAPPEAGEGPKAKNFKEVYDNLDAELKAIV